MAQELVHVENQHLALSFDPKSAAIIDLQLKRAEGDCLLIAREEAPQPLFRLLWGEPTQQPRPDQPPLRAIGGEANLKLVELRTALDSEEAQTIEAIYEVDDSGRRATFQLVLRITHEIQVTGEVANLSRDAIISEVLCPVLGNVKLAEDAEDETLYYPFFSGTQLIAPRRALPTSRRHAEAAAPLTPLHDANGTMVRHLYCGRLSMPWLTVCTDSFGIGVIHCDPTYEVTAFAVYAPAPGDKEGATAPVLDLAASKVRPLKPGQSRTLPPTYLLPYVGTWHQVADRYRAWTKARRFLPPRVPNWVRDSHALTAHYDFKWEDGTYHHTFDEIPKLYRRTARDGITHIFMAGWFTGGFDHMYPEFFPDLQLGTVMDFIDAVRTVRDEGGRATFYINASLFGKESRYASTLGKAWAAKDPQGRPIDRRFFGRDFTVSCRGVPEYQRLMRDTVRWLVSEVGASGVYLDTFAAIGPHLCFDPAHGHPHPAHWNRDAIATVRMVESSIRLHNPEAFTMIEGCSDLYGQWLVAHLIHGWAYPNSYPAMFRYTFPEYVLVDMIYPSKGQSFRQRRISEQAYDQLHRTFIHGCILWMYDQEDERYCTFRTDPEMWDYIKKLLTLREEGKRYFGYGKFMDTVGLGFDAKACDVKRFVADHANERFAPEDREMLAVWKYAERPVTLHLSPDLPESWEATPESLKITARSADGPVEVTYGWDEAGVQVELRGTGIMLLFVTVE